MIVAGGTGRALVGELRGQLLPDRVRDGRFVTREARQRALQRAIARHTQFTPDRIVVLKMEPVKQRLERHPLDHQRAEHDDEGGEDDQIAVREPRGERQRRGQ